MDEDLIRLNSSEFKNLASGCRIGAAKNGGGSAARPVSICGVQILRYVLNCLVYVRVLVAEAEATHYSRPGTFHTSSA